MTVVAGVARLRAEAGNPEVLRLRLQTNATFISWPMLSCNNHSLLCRTTVTLFTALPLHALPQSSHTAAQQATDGRLTAAHLLTDGLDRLSL